MKKIAFIGSYDKIDMLIYVAKILSNMNKKVILIDTTVMKKSRYVVPTMEESKQYITTYEDVDVAIGFDSFETIKNYLAELGREMDYDVAILDIDRAIAYQKFGINKADTHYFVTSFDIYNLKKGINVLAYIDKEAEVTKIYYTKDMSPEEDKYLNFLAKDHRIKWNKDNIMFFPFETSDLNSIFVNQRSGRIQTKGLSSQYIDAVLFLVEDITGESSSKVKKAYKILED